MDVVFFESQAEFREWLLKNHDKTSEIWVGFRKKNSGLPSATYHQAVDEALCFGWIDGIRKSIDDTSYTNRFTPRKRRSNWSEVNIKRVGELIELGLMHPAGLKAFEARDQDKTGQYSYEARTREMNEAAVATFKANPKAWEFFQAQAPSYQKLANWWVFSAKQEATRQRRLAKLIEHSEKGERLPQFVSPRKK